MSQESARVLVPPRPNLGPEPWSEVKMSWRFPVAIGSVAAPLLLAAFWWLMRRRVSRRGRTRLEFSSTTSDDSPSSKLLNMAGQVRESLAARFGPSIRARTTEEIAADEQLRDALGESQFGPLLQLLATADRWKFASPAGNGEDQALLEDLARWDDWHLSFAAGDSEQVGTSALSPVAPRIAFITKPELGYSKPLWLTIVLDDHGGEGVTLRELLQSPDAKAVGLPYVNGLRPSFMAWPVVRLAA